MKLKCLPEDFQVEELSQFEYSSRGGAFAVYKLTKTALGTPEAIDAVVQRWKIQRQQVSYGGLKDRHAITQQYVTIQKGPRKDLEQTSFSLVYQGQTTRPFGPPDISGNRFHIVVRDLTRSAAEQMSNLRESLLVDRLPNYFDDQRFGSLGASQEFIANPWCKGEYERALWLAIAEPNVHDRPGDKEEKRIIRDHWARWELCKEKLPKSSRRSIITYLVDHPQNFKQAFALLRVDMRGLYLSAYQSYLWNHILAEMIRRTVHADDLFNVNLTAQTVPFVCKLSLGEQTLLTSTKLPLPSARLDLEPGPVLELYEQVLERVGLPLRELRVKYPRDSFFSKGERAALVTPHHLKMNIAEDERYAKKFKLMLDFELPRGSYATVLLKRITQIPLEHNYEPTGQLSG